MLDVTRLNVFNRPMRPLFMKICSSHHTTYVAVGVLSEINEYLVGIK